LIIEARLSDGDSDTVNDGDGVLAMVERRDCSLAQLGLTLAEGRSLLAKVQAELVSKQVEWWLPGCKSGATRPLGSDNHIAGLPAVRVERLA
jgi:hypothetical protein